MGAYRMELKVATQTSTLNPYKLLVRPALEGMVGGLNSLLALSKS